MRRMAFLLGLAFAVGIVVGKMGFQVLNAQQDLIRLTPLLTTELIGLEGTEGRLFLFPRHAHRHHTQRQSTTE
jgi:hypothetical protein